MGGADIRGPHIDRRERSRVIKGFLVESAESGVPQGRGPYVPKGCGRQSHMASEHLPDHGMLTWKIVPDKQILFGRKIGQVFELETDLFAPPCVTAIVPEKTTGKNLPLPGVNQRTDLAVGPGQLTCQDLYG